jgi:hypothetical protein
MDGKATSQAESARGGIDHLKITGGMGISTAIEGCDSKVPASEIRPQAKTRPPLLSPQGTAYQAMMMLKTRRGDLCRQGGAETAGFMTI